jgi:hypothetical protein
VWPAPPHRRQQAFAGGEVRSGIAADDRHHRHAVEPLGNDRERRREAQVHHRVHLVGGVGGPVGVAAQHLDRLLRRVQDRPGQHLRAHLVQAELEGGDHTVSPTSAYEAARRGELPVRVIGRRMVVPRVALVRLLDERS